MDLEEQTLHYYLKVFSLILIFFFILILFFIFNVFNRNLNFNKNQVNIERGESFENILITNINNLSNIDIEIVKFYLKIKNIFNENFIHYGNFNISKEDTILDLINLISKPSNILNKITIVEGWSQKQLSSELSKHFVNFSPIPYLNVIADTYYLEKNSNFTFFIDKIKENKNNYFSKFSNHKFLNNFSENEIMIIGSILEKEGLDKVDKQKISSVIFNRLKKNMKLQIDATVVYAITNGSYDLDRKLLLSDLKIKHPYNTYLNYGLPPKPISYVGRKTLDLLFENYQSDFLFYFFNKSLNKHIFSKTYKEHKEKLNEYRIKQ